MLVPRSPRTRWPRKRRYWFHRGLSRPSWWLSAATRSGVAVCPRIASAGLPGSRWTMKNTTTVTPKITGMDWRSRSGTKRKRSNMRHLLSRAVSAMQVARSPGGAGRRRRAAPPCRSGSLRLVDVLEVVVAERRDLEALDLVGHRVGVRRVVEVGRERVVGDLLLQLL